MNALLTVLLILGQVPEGSPMITEPTHPAATQLHLNDDIPFSLGNTAAAPDAKLLWDTSGTHQLQIWLTDCGGGADCVPISILTGTDDVIFTGTLLAADGSSSLPAFGFSGDLGNGMYLTGADSLGLTAGGGLRMRIDANGIYGIPFYSSADGTSGAPRFSWQSDTDLGLYRAGDNILGLSASAGVVLNGEITTPTVNFGAASRAKCTSSADNLLECTNAAGQGVRFGFTTADAVRLTDEVGADLVIEFGDASNTIGQVSDKLFLQGQLGFTFEATADIATDGAARWWFKSLADAEMTASSGIQYGGYFGSELAQTGTAQFVSLEIAQIVTSQGSGQDYLLRANWAGGAVEFSVEDDGDTLIAGSLALEATPTTDVDPVSAVITAADAWSQATAGQRDGATEHISAGIRTLQIVCDNFGWAALDTVNITVNGVLADIIEGTDFSVGIDDDTTCVALGAAIVTEAIGLTPDCTTTAGTCYLQPDQRSVHAVDSIAFVDGAADGVFATLVEGTDGSIAFHTAFNAAVLDANGDFTLSNGKFIPRASDPDNYVRHGGTNKIAVYAGGSERGVFTTTELDLSVNLKMDATDTIYFSGRGKIASSADGIFERTINTGTQGLREDLSADNIVTWTDQAGVDFTNVRFGTAAVDANTFQNALAGATATFSSINVAGAATGAVNSVTGNVTGVGDFASGAYTAGTGDSSNTAGDSNNAMLKSGDAADDSGDVDVKMGVATAGTSGDFHVIGDGVNTYFTVSGETGTATHALSVGGKLLLDASTTEHTGTDGVLDINLVPTTAATGVVAADIHITAPALGIEATTHVGLNLQYTGDAQDEGASIVQLIQLGFDPNTSGTTVYGLYGNDNDLDYFIFNDGTAESRFDGEVHFANNAAAATFGLVTTDADVVLAFDAVTAQGSITYMEDEDRFDFDNDVDVIGDLTAGTITSDAAVTGVTLVGQSAKGAATTTTLNVESVTFPGGGAASAVTVGSIIPDGAILDGITTYVTTADNGGACTGYTVGDGVDDDLFGAAATETQGTTTTPGTGTATVFNPQWGGPFEVTITGTGGNCVDMVVRITAHYRLLSADTTL